MIEVNKSDIDGFTSNDSEYAAELWSYIRRNLTVRESLDIVRGESHVDGKGLEAMENYSLHGKFLLGDDRPPTANFTSYQHAIENRLESMPVRLAYQHWVGEIEMAKSYHYQPFGLVSVLLAGEEVFDIDASDEIIEALEFLDDCETKLDMLEARGAISGDEWYERTEALDADSQEAI